MTPNPKVIQGGMGVGISSYLLAKVVAMRRGLGTVSGVLATEIVVRMLQNGDPGGHIRRALAHFPSQKEAMEFLGTYFRPNGRPQNGRYHVAPLVTLTPSRMSLIAAVCSNFAIVWLAKEGHASAISINYLTKVELPLLPSLYGAMLAGVNFITMGAGIPLQIPSVINAFAAGRPAVYRMTVTGSTEGHRVVEFDPKRYFEKPLPIPQRPGFLPIVSSDALASIMVKKLPGEIHGFVVEGPTAGGHNAPPRGKVTYNERGEPLYGPRDIADCQKLCDLGLPFWLAGSHASPAGLADALRLGAEGIQAGSIFALSSESGMDPLLKQEIIRAYYNGSLDIKTDALASPTGFPFKVVQMLGTISEQAIFKSRTRICNRKGLIVPHQMQSGRIVYRCSAEPIADYEAKEGRREDAENSACLCNALLTTTRLGDVVEPAIITLGDRVSFLDHLTKGPEDSYTAAQALDYLLGRPES